MIFFNVFIFFGLILSGTAMVLGYFGAEYDQYVSFVGLLMGYGAFFGWFAVFFAVISFVIGYTLLLLGKVSDFWATLYPLNLGFAILIGTFVKYVGVASLLLVVVVFLITISLAFVIFKTNAVKRKLFPLAVVLLVFVGDHFISFFIAGVILRTFAIMGGSMRTTYCEVRDLRIREGGPI